MICTINGKRQLHKQQVLRGEEGGGIDPPLVISV